MKNRYYFLLAAALLSCSLFSMEKEKRELSESEETEQSAATKRQKNNSTNVSTYPCTYLGCTKICKSNEALREHIYRYHRKKSDTFSCDQCNKSYSLKDSLSKHKKRKHGNIYNFRCDQPGCSSAFITQQELTLHMVYNHSDARNFLCDQCTYSAKTQQDLTQHKTHKHSDSQCTYSGKTQTNLTVHEASNRNEKTLFCLDPDCALAFKTKRDLSRHMKTKHSEFITNAPTLSTSDISANNAQDINPPQSPEFAALAAVASQLNTNNQNEFILIPSSFIDMLSTPQTPLNGSQMISTSTNEQPSSQPLSFTTLLEAYDQQDANTNQINTAPINSATGDDSIAQEDFDVFLCEILQLPDNNQEDSGPEKPTIDNPNFEDFTIPKTIKKDKWRIL